MLTVKHVDYVSDDDRAPQRVEAIYCGTHVKYVKVARAMTLYSGDTVVAEFYDSGMAYVVNEAGKTVGFYDLSRGPGGEVAA